MSPWHHWSGTWLELFYRPSSDWEAHSVPCPDVRHVSWGAPSWAKTWGLGENFVRQKKLNWLLLSFIQLKIIFFKKAERIALLLFNTKICSISLNKRRAILAVFLKNKIFNWIKERRSQFSFFFSKFSREFCATFRLHDKSISASRWIKTNLDCSYTFPIVLAHQTEFCSAIS